MESLQILKSALPGGKKYRIRGNAKQLALNSNEWASQVIKRGRLSQIHKQQRKQARTKIQQEKRKKKKKTVEGGTRIHQPTENPQVLNTGQDQKRRCASNFLPSPANYDLFLQKQARWPSKAATTLYWRILQLNSLRFQPQSADEGAKQVLVFLDPRGVDAVSWGLFKLPCRHYRRGIIRMSFEAGDMCYQYWTEVSNELTPGDELREHARERYTAITELLMVDDVVSNVDMQRDRISRWALGQWHHIRELCEIQSAHSSGPDQSVTTLSRDMAILSMSQQGRDGLTEDLNTIGESGTLNNIANRFNTWRNNAPFDEMEGLIDEEDEEGGAWLSRSS